MSEVVLKNIEIAERELKMRFPEKLREFILALPDQEIGLGDQTWHFRVVSDEVYAPEKNPIVFDSRYFREQWKIPAVVFAHNGLNDYLVVLPSGGSNLPYEQIYQLIACKSTLEFFASDIYAAYNGQFYPASFDNFVTWKLDDNGEVIKKAGLEHFQTGESTGERFFFDEYDRMRSLTDDMIDDEVTGKYQEILDNLHELTTQPDYAAWAWYKLAELYFKGFGPLAQNMQLALEYNGKAVELGHARSMANRAWCYFSGFGLEKNVEKAYELIKAANDSTLQGGKEKDGLYYEMLLQIKSEYLKQKKKK